LMIHLPSSNRYGMTGRPTRGTSTTCRTDSSSCHTFCASEGRSTRIICSTRMSSTS
jgi:hypothetical protein